MSKYPLHSLKAIVSELEAFDLKTVDDFTIHEKIRQLLGGYAASQLSVDPSRRLYRIRKNLTERLRSSSGLEWHPPLFREIRQVLVSTTRSSSHSGTHQSDWAIRFLLR